MTLRIRPMTEADIPALASLLVRAYREGDERRFAGRLGIALASAGVERWVAESDGRPVGMVLANSYATTSYVALMGVEPGCQRMGIGQALMEALLAWVDARRLPAELMATPEGHGLYLRYGFRDAGEGEVWRGNAPENPLPQGIRVASDHRAIRELDRSAFGAERGDALTALLRDPSCTLLQAEDGYAVAQGDAGVLGPLIAGDPETATRLMVAASRRLKPEHRVNAVARPEVARLLVSLGYRKLRSVQRMVRGELPAGRRDRIWVLLNLGQG